MAVVKWNVSAPDKVKPGEQFTVTVEVYAYPATPVKAIINLFGKTYNKQGTASSPYAPLRLSFLVTAPTQPGTYTGSVSLYEYSDIIISGPKPIVPLPSPSPGEVMIQ